MPSSDKFDVDKFDEAEKELDSLLKKWMNSWDVQSEGASEVVFALKKVVSDSKVEKILDDCYNKLSHPSMHRDSGDVQ